jgi:hypothetical protein
MKPLDEFRTEQATHDVLSSSSVITMFFQVWLARMSAAYMSLSTHDRMKASALG